MKTSFTCILAAALAVLSAGCNRDNVKVYHVENSDSVTPPPPAAAPAAMPATMPAGLPVPDAAALPKLKYTLPDGWQEKTPSEMRVASFGISENGKNADVSVIPLGGMAGGDLANVNRWRGQVGLGALADGDLQKLAEKVEVAGQPADLYDVSGKSSDSGDAERIVGVIFHNDDTTWFFKMTGDPDLVEKQKPAFVALLKSFQFGEPAAPAAMDLSQLPPSHPPVEGSGLGTQNSLVPNGDTAVAGGTGGVPAWTVPAGWQSLPPSQFLLAEFSIAGTNGATAEVNAAVLAGDGGGLLPNLNRWRAQLGLPTVEDILTTPMDVAGAQAQVVDFTGTDSNTGKPARLVGIVLPLGGQTWFYKLMGDPDIVAQQKDAFVKFVQSAKYPDAH